MPRLHTRHRKPRRFATALGSLGLVSTLTISGLVGEGVEMTEAARNDTEQATAEIDAAWPEAFVSVVAGSAKSSDTALNGLLFPPHDITYESRYRWTQQLQKAPTSVDTTSANPGSNEKFSRTFDRRFQGIGNPVNDSSPHLLENTGGGIDTVTNALHNWRASKNFSNSNPTYPGTFRCLVINEEYESADPEDQRCGLGSNFAAASNTTDAYGFSISTGSVYITYLNAANLYTGVTCNESSAVAHTPTGRVDVGLEQGGTNPYLSFSGIGSNRVRTVWANGIADHENGFSPGLSSGIISPAWAIAPLGLDPYARVMPIITQESSGLGEQPYAISEIAAYVEVANQNLILPASMRAKMYFVLSRSECGVKRVSDTALPEQRPVFPNAMPGGNGLTPYDEKLGEYTPAFQQSQPSAMRGLVESRATTSTLPPATTVTSPSEHSTASVTTTSAPPNPEDSTTSANSTSSSRTATSTQPTKAEPTSSAETTVPTVTATRTTTPTTNSAPEIVVPRDPGTLDAAARTELVNTVTVGESELDVVVVGNSVPTDARAGARALETWLDGGTPSTTWATFTSDDPDQDGWRWAAISQKTGTVVYIR